MQTEEAGLQTGVIGVAEQSALVRQPTQRFEVLHTGVAPEQSLLVRHATHSFATVSQIGAAVLEQSESFAHVTHEPAFMPVVTHADPPGFPMQSALSVQARHVWVVVLQVGVLPLQSELNSQSTHVPVGKSQISVLPPHSVAFVAEH